MSACRHCGVEKPAVAKRGDLVVQTSPPGVWWRGSPVFGIQGYRLALLHLLCSQGRASHGALEMIGAGPDTGSCAIKVQLHHLRRQLPRGITIKSVHGWGYQLDLEETTMSDTDTAAPPVAIATPRQRLVDHVSELPDDTRAMMLVYADCEGKVRAFGPGLDWTHALKLSTAASAVISRNPAPIAVKEPPL